MSLNGLPGEKTSYDVVYRAKFDGSDVAEGAAKARAELAALQKANEDLNKSQAAGAREAATSINSRNQAEQNLTRTLKDEAAAEQLLAKAKNKGFSTPQEYLSFVQRETQAQTLLNKAQNNGRDTPAQVLSDIKDQTTAIQNKSKAVSALSTFFSGLADAQTKSSVTDPFANGKASVNVDGYTNDLEKAAARIKAAFGDISASSGKTNLEVNKFAEGIKKDIADASTSMTSSNNVNRVGFLAAFANGTKDIQRGLDGISSSAKKAGQDGGKAASDLDMAWKKFKYTLDSVKSSTSDIFRSGSGAGGIGGGLGALFSSGAAAGGSFISVIGAAIPAITGFWGILAAGVTILPIVISGVLALGTGIVGLVAALGTLLTVAGAIVPIMASFAVAAGALYLAIKPVITAVQALDAATTKSQTAAALKNLSPAAASAAEAISSLVKAFKGIDGKAIEQAFWVPLLPALKGLSAIVKPLTAGLTEMAAAIGNVVGNGLTMFETFAKSSDFANLMGEAANTVSDLGFGLENLLSIITKLAVAGAPITQMLTQGFLGLTEKFNNFLDTASKNGTLNNFFDGVAQRAHTVATIFGDFFGGMNRVFQAFLPVGDAFLQEIEGWAKEFDKFSQNKNGLDTWAKNATPFLKDVGDILAMIVSGIVKLGSNPQNLKDLTTVLDGLKKVIGPLFNLAQSVFNLFSRFAAVAAPVVASALSAIARAAQDMANWIGNLEKSKTGMDILKGILTGIATLVVSASLLSFIGKMTDLAGKTFTDLKKVLNLIPGVNLGGKADDPTGIKGAGETAAASMKTAITQGGEAAAASIKEAMSTGGKTAGAEIGTAEVAGGATAGVEMAGAEAGGGFLGGVAGWFKGGGFTKILGAAFLGAITFAIASGVFSKIFPNNSTNNNPSAVVPNRAHEATGTVTGAVTGGKIAGLPGAIVGGAAGFGIASLYDYVNNPNPQVSNSNKTGALNNIRKEMQLSGASNAWTASPKDVIKWAISNAVTGAISPDVMTALITQYDPQYWSQGATINHRGAAAVPKPVVPDTQQLSNSLIPQGSLLNPGLHPLASTGSSGSFGRGLGFSMSAGGPPASITKAAMSPSSTAAGSATIKASIYFPNVMATFEKTVVGPLTKALTNLKASLYWPNVMTNFQKTVVSPIEKGLTNFKASLYWPNVMTTFMKTVHDPISAALTNFKASLYWPNVMTVFNKTVHDPIQNGLTNFRASMYWPNVLTTFLKTVHDPIQNNLTNFKATMYWPAVIATFTKTVLDPIQKDLTNIKATMYWPNVVGDFTKNVINPMVALITTMTTKTVPGLWKASIPHWFDNFAQVAGSAIGNGMVRAINWAITNVLNGGLINSANKVIGSVGGTKIPPLGGVSAKFAGGGYAPGHGNTDSLPAWLTPGEFVIRKDAASVLGRSLLDRLNHAEKYKFAAGGAVPSLDGTAPKALPGTPAYGSGSIIPGSIHGAIFGGLKDALGNLYSSLINPMLSKLPNSVAGSLTGSSGTALEKAIQKFGASLDAKALSAMGGTVPAGQHRAIIDAALKAAGIPNGQWPIWEAGLNTLVSRESAWNASAVNKTDTNANGPIQSDGAPKNSSRGLAQCVTLDTMILTKRGWLKHDEVIIGDETIGFNPQTGMSEWTRITQVVHYDEAEVWRIGSKTWWADVTPNHRWWSETPHELVTDLPEVCPDCGWVPGTGRDKKLPPIKDKARSVSTHRARKHKFNSSIETTYVGEFVTPETFSSKNRLRLAAPVDSPHILDITDDEAAILGWLHGDGHLSKITLASGVKWDGTIYQSKPDQADSLRKLLASVPHGESTRQIDPNSHILPQGTFAKSLMPATCFRIRRAYMSDLMTRSRLDSVPEDAFVLLLSSSQRKAWLEAMIAAEGTTCDNYTRIPQNDGAVQEAIKLAVYMEGYRPSVTKVKDHDNYALVGMKSPIAAVSMFDEPLVLEMQPVWCVQTELTTLTVQLDGHVFLTGNTIPATFNAYHAAGTSSNIYDPVANIAAAIRYILARYGSISNVQQANAGLPPKGYNSGGFVMPDFGAGFASTPSMSYAASSPRTLSAAAQSLGGNSVGMNIEQMHIHNPIREPAGESVQRQLVKTRTYAGRG